MVRMVGADSQTAGAPKPHANGNGHAAAWHHGVQFYDDDSFLSGVVAGFLADGLVLGEPVAILATEPHRDLFARRLRSHGLDWAEAREAGQLHWLDACAALDAIMDGGLPDRQRFEDQIGGWIRAVVQDKDGPDVRLRAYGELVDLLWRDGNADAALALEDLWNDLARTHSFSLLCAYSRGNIYRESRGAGMREICERHDHVLPSQNGNGRPAGASEDGA